MLTAATFERLNNAAQKYLDNLTFGIPEVAALMAEISGNNLDGTDALAWSAYWTWLNIYKEGVRDGKEDFEAPEVCMILCQLEEQSSHFLCSYPHIY
jgi:hypothetical protein